MKATILSSLQDKTLMAVNIKTTVFLDVTYNILGTCRSLGGTAASIYVVEKWEAALLKTATVLSSETSLIFHNIVGSRILHDGNADPPPEV
jgi:hypothetical protein